MGNKLAREELGDTLRVGVGGRPKFNLAGLRLQI